MAIYTRSGDDGSTSLFGGKRISKADIQVDAYGGLDELTSTLGMLLTHIRDPKEKPFLQEIQRDLYTIMGFLAGANQTDLLSQKEKIESMEKKIDVMTAKLPPLNDFIIPGGSEASCWAHIARTVCRRAERSVILYFERAKKIREKKTSLVLSYLNRLSDLLFTYARVFSGDREYTSKKL